MTKETTMAIVTAIIFTKMSWSIHDGKLKQINKCAELAKLILNQSGVK